MQAGFLFPRDIQSSLTEEEGKKLAELAKGRVVLELGAWLGRSTVCLGQTAKTVVSIDWHQGDAHAARAGRASTLPGYLRSLERYGLSDRVVTVVSRFEEVLPFLADDSFDLVFLDGFHSYEQVSADIQSLRRLVRPGGWFAFHDYGVARFGVTRAVDEAFGRPLDVVGTLAVVRERS
jgi:predicted O-methyltransferase YrrM